MKSFKTVIAATFTVYIAGCVTDIKKQTEPEPLLTPIPRWLPYETPNKTTLQRLFERLEGVRSNSVPFQDFINECETRLKNDESLMREKKDVAVIYLWCAWAALHGRQPSLAIDYLLKEISMLEQVQHSEKKLLLAQAYNELAWVYAGINETDKSLQAAKTVIERFPDVRLPQPAIGQRVHKPMIRQYDPRTNQVTSISDTTVSRTEYPIDQAPLIALSTVRLLSRIFVTSHREDEGIQYFRKVRQEHPNSEIGLSALVEEGNLQLHKRNIAAVATIKQELRSKVGEYPHLQYQVEQTLRGWDHIEKIHKPSKE